MFKGFHFRRWRQLACLLLIAVSAGALPATTYADRPRIALVLSGGGALGLAHIGVLKALEVLRVPVDCVVGTSIGAMIGGIYATGVDPSEMERALSNNDIALLFDDWPPRAERPQSLKRDDYSALFDFSFGFNNYQVELPAGASSGYRFELFLKEMIGTGSSLKGMDFDRLPVPYRAVATNLETGEMKVFDQGELPRIMRASMSLPAIVEPIEIDGQLYVDGGLVRNMPVNIGRQLCGDVVIAVRLGTKPKTREELTNSLAVAMQSIVLLTEQNVQASLLQMRDTDILIEPDLSGFTAAGFSDQFKIINHGVEATLQQKEALSQLALNEQDYEQWLAQKQSKKLPPLEIVEIKASGETENERLRVMRDIHSQPGDDFKLKKLHQDIVSAYGRGDYSYIGYSVVPKSESENQLATINIEATNKTWGPGFLKFGLGAAADFNSPTQFNLLASYRRNWLNSLGGSWRTDVQVGYESLLNTEYRQPLLLRRGAFFSANAGYNRSAVRLYRRSESLGEAQVEFAEVGLDLGVSGKAGELLLGPYSRHVETEPNFGILNSFLERETFVESGVRLRGIYDRLDSPVFPRSGLLARVDVTSVIEDWSTDYSYTQVEASLRWAYSLGQNTLSVDLSWGEALNSDEDIPLYRRFTLGGPKRLSGLDFDQLNGSRFNLASFNYYRQYASLPPQLGRGLYVGVSLDAGRINDPLMRDSWQWQQGGSIYWGADTILGTALVGVGTSSLGQSSWYLILGKYF